MPLETYRSTTASTEIFEMLKTISPRAHSYSDTEWYSVLSVLQRSQTVAARGTAAECASQRSTVRRRQSGWSRRWASWTLTRRSNAGCGKSTRRRRVTRQLGSCCAITSTRRAAAAAATDHALSLSAGKSQRCWLRQDERRDNTFIKHAAKGLNL